MIWPTFGGASSAGRRGFERRERARDLAGLVVEPLRLVLFGRPPAALVDHQDRRIHDAVGQRLQPQARRSARSRPSGRSGRRRRDDRDIRGSRGNRTGPCRPRAPARESCRADSAGGAVSAGFMVSAGSIVISPSRPSTLTAILTLRPNGRTGACTQGHHGGNVCTAFVERRPVVTSGGGRQP